MSEIWQRKRHCHMCMSVAPTESIMSQKWTLNRWNSIGDTTTTTNRDPYAEPFATYEIDACIVEINALEVSDRSQTTFLPLRFILDNIVLTQETLHWAKTSKHPTVFLKLDFSKAYNKVSWRFLFHAMKMMGIREKFNKWVKLFFGNASATVNLNNSPGNSFKVERE